MKCAGCGAKYTPDGTGNQCKKCYAKWTAPLRKLEARARKKKAA